jgi:3-oxoacyl-[acyl-carrier-protein] synthase II
MSKIEGVAVTGMGALTPYGDVDDLLKGLTDCRTCLEPLSLFETDIKPLPVVGQIRDLPKIKAASGTHLSRTDALSIVAAQRAIHHARLDPSDIIQAGLCIATTVGGLSELRPEISRDPQLYYRKFGFPRSYQRGHTVDVLASQFGIRGPRLSVSTACASGSMSVAIAARMVLDGSAPVMLAGGSEALCWFTLSGFNSLQALDPNLCRPFDQQRNGLNIGEGAAILILENLERALQRKAKIQAILLGWGMSNDAHHLTAPDENGRGLARSIEAALRMAEVEFDRVGYVNAHGTGTPLNDPAEIGAYRAVSLNRTRPLPVSSTKSYFGHTLGAAGALEAIVTMLSLQHQVLFPTLRLNHPLDAPGIDWLMGEIRRQPLTMAVSASAGFGGSNASLLFGLPN